MFDALWIHLISLQVIIVNSTSPCWMNYTAGIDIWQNCGMGTDYIKAALAPWVWVTGGYFSMIIVGIFVLISWIKYQKAVYPLMIGTFGFFPIAYTLFPASWISISIVFAMIFCGFLIFYAFISQTNES